MIRSLMRWTVIAGILSAGVVPLADAGECPALLDHSFAGLIDGKPQSLCQYQGKVILVVNTASQCGFTPQYDGLEKLYTRLKDKGVVVLGFPSNDFGQQEPGSKTEIAEFCRLNYGVDFPMFDKTEVTGKGANAFYRKLTEISGSKPGWNFHKYLINRDATRVLSFDSATTPEDKVLLRRIDEFRK
jgi:glutathione peroxidase